MPGDVPHVIEQSFTVSYRYSVVFCRDVFGANSGVLAQILSPTADGPDRVAVVIDDGVARHHPELVERILLKSQSSEQWELVGRPLVIGGGEAVKNDPQQLERLTAYFEALGLDRHCYVFAIGGGAVLDAVGFACAIVHRGVRLIRFPTTVLGQNDSGVGVKNGINRLGAKNFLGTFAPPNAVVNDLEFLKTLSQRDFVAGLAEAVKVSLIKDSSFFNWMEQNAGALVARDSGPVTYMIERTAKLHLSHIAEGGDPFESGSKRPLDFGHWVAHKLESLTGNELKHGEAVAIGIALDVLYSSRVRSLPELDARRVISLLLAFGLPIYDVALETKDELGRPAYLSGLEEFRQHLGGRLNVTLLDQIGTGVQVAELENQTIELCRLDLAELMACQR